MSGSQYILTAKREIRAPLKYYTRVEVTQEPGNAHLVRQTPKTDGESTWYTLVAISACRFKQHLRRVHFG